jgi:hypothetical protein
MEFLWLSQFALPQNCVSKSKGAGTYCTGAGRKPFEHTNASMKLSSYRALLLLLLVGSALGGSLLRDWKQERDGASQAVLFATCTLSADSTSINGIVCNLSTQTMRVGCLAPPANRAYGCDVGSGQWSLM